MKYISVYFILKPKKKNGSGLAPIYCRISQSGKIKEFSTGNRIAPEKWCAQTQKWKGTNEAAKTFNRKLETLRIDICQAQQVMAAKGDGSLEAVYRQLKGAPSEQTVHSIMDLFIQQKKDLLSIEGSIGRLKKYIGMKGKLTDFLQKNYYKEDYPVSQLDLEFIARFRNHLLRIGNHENTANGYLKLLKKIGTYAFNQGWIFRNPFSSFKLTYKETLPRHLSIDEVKAVLNVKLPPVEKLQRALDCFIFAMFTGLAYSDLKKLIPANIAKGLDDKPWLEIFRSKTKGRSYFPLLPIPLDILSKYKDDPYCLHYKKCLPVLSNQKYNEHLKLIAILAKIDKPLTSHVARHTFAVLGLTFGLSMEVLGQNMGHQAGSKITSVYGRVVSHKINNEMNKLEERISSEFTYNAPSENSDEK